MKKLLMICALVFSVVAFAKAQQPGGGRMMASPEERVKQLDEKVKLTDDQKAKAKAVFTEAAETMKKMRDEMMAGGGDRMAMMEKMQKMNTDVDTKVNAFLNDDQKKIYKEWQDQVKADRQKMMRERMGGGGNQ